jgi:hypothetical protein
MVPKTGVEWGSVRGFPVFGYTAQHAAARPSPLTGCFLPEPIPGILVLLTHCPIVHDPR